MSQIQITDWIDFVPAEAKGRIKCTLTLPAFSVSGIEWIGASEIVQQYNFSAGQNFYIPTRPSKPENCNFGLCIRYRVGNTVTRYRMWDIAGLTLNNENAPLYNGQIIRGNFVLEIWSLENETTAVLSADITMNTSVRRVPVSFYDGGDADQSLADGTLVTYAELQSTSGNVTVPTENLVDQYVAEDYAVNGGTGLGEWPSSVGSNVLYAASNGVSSPADNPSILENVAAINNRTALGFDGVLNGLFGEPTNTAFPVTLYMLVNMTAWTSLKVLLTSKDQLNNYFALLERTSSPNVSPANSTVAYFTGQDLTVGEYKIVRLTFYLDGADYLCDFEVDGQVSIGGGPLNIESFNGLGICTCGSSGFGDQGAANVATVLRYDEKIDLDSEKDIAVKAYINQEYFGETGIGLPLTFNEASYWLDNA